MSTRNTTFAVAGAIAAASIFGATQVDRADSAAGVVGTPDAGVELEWGTGSAPRYVPARSGAATGPDRGNGPRHELHWGDGGPPVLVRIDAD